MIWRQRMLDKCLILRYERAHSKQVNWRGSNELSCCTRTRRTRCPRGRSPLHTKSPHIAWRHRAQSKVLPPTLRWSGTSYAPAYIPLQVSAPVVLLNLPDFQPLIYSKSIFPEAKTWEKIGFLIIYQNLRRVGGEAQAKNTVNRLLDQTLIFF